MDPWPSDPWALNGGTTATPTIRSFATTNPFPMSPYTVSPMRACRFSIVFLPSAISPADSGRRPSIADGTTCAPNTRSNTRAFATTPALSTSLLFLLIFRSTSAAPTAIPPTPGSVSTAGMNFFCTSSEPKFGASTSVSHPTP